MREEEEELGVEEEEEEVVEAKEMGVEGAAVREGGEVDLEAAGLGRNLEL